MKLDEDYFASLLGAPLSRSCRSYIAAYDWSYDVLDRESQTALIRSITEEIASGAFSKTGDREKWERAWDEIAREFAQSGAEALTPKYLRYEYQPQLLRLNGQFIMPTQPGFELHWYKVVREWVRGKYLADVSNIYEFGSGTGWNLLAMTRAWPRHYIGLDWSDAAVNLANTIGKRYEWNIEGRKFNMFQPDRGMMIEPNSAVLTVGTLEQLGGNWDFFLGYLLGQRPRICVHLEPLIEWYDLENDFDRVAAEYHRARNYLTGFAGHLAELEEMNIVKIIRAQRSNFGGKYMDAYSMIVWEPA